MPEGRPFILNQPILTAGDAGGERERNALIGAALGRTAPGFGGDGPETALEGLYQVATGLGFDGDGDGSTTGFENVQPAGSLEAQQQQDGSGDVPAFSTLIPTVPHSGSIGGAGFRSDALRLVIVATDICSVTAFDPGLRIPADVSTASAVVPVADFACSSTEPGDDRFGFVSDSKVQDTNKVVGAVVPSGGATLPATVAALASAGIRVLGVLPGSSSDGISAAAEPAGPSEDPSVFLSALARLTGAVDSAGAPLVFDTATEGTPLKDAIVNAVVSATTTTTANVALAPDGDVPAGLAVSADPPVVQGVPAGGRACFQVTFLGSGIPSGTFGLDFTDDATGASLGSIPVTVECVPPTTTTTTTTVPTTTTTTTRTSTTVADAPTTTTSTTVPTTTTIPARCGDGNVDASLGEQCDPVRRTGHRARAVTRPATWRRPGRSAALPPRRATPTRCATARPRSAPRTCRGRGRAV